MNLFKKMFSSGQKNIVPEIKENEFGIPYIEKQGEAETSKDWLEDAVGLFQIMDFTNAVNAADKAIELDPKNADAYHIRGSIKNAMGLKSEACIDWKKCVELGGEAQNLIDENC